MAEVQLTVTIHDGGRRSDKLLRNNRVRLVVDHYRAGWIYGKEMSARSDGASVTPAMKKSSEGGNEGAAWRGSGE